MPTAYIATAKMAVKSTNIRETSTSHSGVIAVSRTIIAYRFDTNTAENPRRQFFPISVIYVDIIAN
jgi:hypothetical protein